jgi:hypothetical protein
MVKIYYGSNINDTLLGTALDETITALGGDDLISTGGGADEILMGDGTDLVTGISFDLAKLNKSDSRGLEINGGTGYDTVIVELKAAKRVSEVDDIMKAMSVKGAEDFIYSFGNVDAKQSILGSNKTNITETIVVGGGNAVVDMRGGDDYLFTGAGDDTVNGGAGADFIHVGEGRNTVSGGKGADYFHFRLTGGYQYTEITDFKASEDKIVISIDADQVNTLFGFSDPNWDALVPRGSVRGYGAYYGAGDDINDYVSHNFGRIFDRGSFPDTVYDNEVDSALWAEYEQATGSIIIKHREIVDEQLVVSEVLVGHIKPGTDIDASDFLMRMF